MSSVGPSFPSTSECSSHYDDFNINFHIVFPLKKHQCERNSMNFE